MNTACKRLVWVLLGLLLAVGCARPTPIPTATAAPTPAPTAASDCAGAEAEMALVASPTTMRVGESVTLTVILHNTGCLPLGLPQYRLFSLEEHAAEVVALDEVTPVSHTRAVAPGESDTAVFVVRALHPGQVPLQASASYEVHGSSGATWGMSSAPPVTITVTP